MNAQTQVQPYACEPTSIDFAAFHGFAPPPGATRYEGWTPEKQRLFLEAVSEGLPIKQACNVVGLSKQSAYALRQSPRGAGFALGWEAAVLLARNALADELMDRAFNGVREKVTSDDGRIATRHKQDNRLAMAVLNRLDRMAARGKTGQTAAQLVAADFAQYLALIERDGGPARAGMFLGARVEPAAEDELAPIRTLARADKWLRTHTDIAEPLDTSDLDPAQRAGWTAEQWARAEAAGLVKLAPENQTSSQASQPPSQPAAYAAEPVWWDETLEEWRTHFPPPADFDGGEDGDYGDDDYSRSLSDAEQAAMEKVRRKATAERRTVETAERDAWLAALAQEAAPAPDAAGAVAPDAGDAVQPG
jgi:hypothetical protein